MKRHELDVVSLVFGLVFGAIASWWGVTRLGNLNLDIGWPLAAALIVAGMVGLVAALPKRSRTPEDADDSRPDEDPAYASRR